ncbi:unnamed protein product [Gongylonema pulchrum]|uniref:Secreted protein n=1 Tax=Gongylonema pulchrum TaxID=637853 RepID=A0A183DSN1_9BILA|nr:unnamed protein product [Gongylonema pulchrum]
MRYLIVLAALLMVALCQQQQIYQQQYKGGNQPRQNQQSGGVSTLTPVKPTKNQRKRPIAQPAIKGTPEKEQLCQQKLYADTYYRSGYFGVRPSIEKELRREL